MTIYTRFGSQIEEVLAIDEDGWVSLRLCDGRIREWHCSQLRADGGIQEIFDAAPASDALRQSFANLQKALAARQAALRALNETLEALGDLLDDVEGDQP